MRIISGKFRGRVLFSPKNKMTRPSSSMVRGSVFNILQNKIEGAEFLDLFAGSGLMGLEALSRGAKHATFIEKEKNAQECLQKNILTLHVENESTLLRGDALILLKAIAKKHKKFDVIYIDPPYSKEGENRLLKESLSMIQEGDLLNEEGVLFFEESSKYTHIPSLEGISLVDTRTFGNTILVQYKKISE